MRTSRLVLFLITILVIATTQADVYRWVDESGSVMYGDKPPKNSSAKRVELPTLTVADALPAEPSATQSSSTHTPPAEEDKPAYSDFKINAPQADEAIRANDGNFTVAINLKPALKAGDGIVLYLDGKQAAAGSQLNFELKEIDRGEHSVFAVLNDAKGNIIQNTETVKFSLLRASVIQNK